MTAASLRPALLLIAVALSACGGPSERHTSVPAPTITGAAVSATDAAGRYEPVLDELAATIARRYPDAAVSVVDPQAGTVSGCVGVVGARRWSPLAQSDETATALHSAYADTLAKHGFGAVESVKRGGPFLEWRATDAHGALADAQLRDDQFSVALYYPAEAGHCR